MKKLLCNLLLLLGLPILFPITVHAQSTSLGIFPPIMSMNVTPPSAISQPIVIKNFGDENVNLGISFRYFKSSEHNNGEVTYLNSTDPIPGNDPNIFSKMQLLYNNQPITAISLAPNESKKIELKMAIPADEPASDYYFSILFINQGIGNDQSNVSAISGAIAMNVLLSIGPQGPTTGAVDQFSAPFFVQHGPLPFTVSITNTSKHFINPKGTIVIQNMFGQYVGKLNLLPVNILEDSSRFLPDDKNLNATKAVWPEKFLLGFYKAKLTITLSDQGPLFTKNIYFFALPTSAMLIIAFVILAGTVIIIRVRKRLKKL